MKTAILSILVLLMPCAMTSSDCKCTLEKFFAGTIHSINGVTEDMAIDFELGLAMVNATIISTIGLYNYDRRLIHVKEGSKPCRQAPVKPGKGTFPHRCVPRIADATRVYNTVPVPGQPGVCRLVDFTAITPYGQVKFDYTGTLQSPPFNDYRHYFVGCNTTSYLFG